MKRHLTLGNVFLRRAGLICGDDARERRDFSRRTIRSAGFNFLETGGPRAFSGATAALLSIGAVLWNGLFNLLTLCANVVMASVRVKQLLAVAACWPIVVLKAANVYLL